MAATPAWLAGIEAMLNRGIDASLQAQRVATRLNATAVRLEIDGLTPIWAGVSGKRLSLIAVGASAPGDDARSVDATIAGSPWALLQLAGGGSATGALGGAATVRGNAEIADAYRRLMSLARPEFEEELARWVGDLPARRLSQLLRRTVAWAQKTRRTAGDNLAEYLQEESRDIVNKPELEEFLTGVDELRETADRIEARLARLEQRLKGSVP